MRQRRSAAAATAAEADAPDEIDGCIIELEWERGEIAITTAAELEWDPAHEWERDEIDGCIIECRAPCAADALDFDYVVEPGRRRGEARTVWEIESAALPAALAMAIPACAADSAAVCDALGARRARVAKAVRLDSMRIDAEAAALEAAALAQATARRNRGRVRASPEAAAVEGGELAVDPNAMLDYESGDDVDKSYVECSACMQWRELPSFVDPSALAETWVCADAHMWIAAAGVAAVGCATRQDVYRVHVLAATVAIDAIKAAFLAVAAAATYECTAEGGSEDEWNLVAEMAAAAAKKKEDVAVRQGQPQRHAATSRSAVR